MKTFKLLPRGFRFLGLALIFLVIVIFIIDPEVCFGEMSIFEDPEGMFVFTVPSFFESNFMVDGKEVSFAFIRWIRNDLINELLLTVMLIGVWMVAFAKIKGEDEYSQQLRLESMVKAIIWNSVLLLILNFMIYDGLFLYVMISQLFSFLLIFSVIFAIKVRKQRKILVDEE